MSGKIRIKLNRLPELKGDLRVKAGQAVRKAALDIEAEAKAHAPVDTGALKNSIYTASAGKSDYSAAASAAHSANPKAQLFPDKGKAGTLRAVVAVGVSYGALIEFGGVKRAGTPFMYPAAQKVLPEFEKAIQQLLSKLGQS